MGAGPGRELVGEAWLLVYLFEALQSPHLLALCSRTKNTLILQSFVRFDFNLWRETTPSTCLKLGKPPCIQPRPARSTSESSDAVVSVSQRLLLALLPSVNAGDMGVTKRFLERYSTDTQTQAET